MLFQDEELGAYAKHLTTQAKIPHRWEFRHDHIGYNYRMPNINAALGCAQLENLDRYVADKRETAARYVEFFKGKEDITFFTEPADCKSNYWLNAVVLKDKAAQLDFLEYTNDHGLSASMPSESASSMRERLGRRIKLSRLVSPTTKTFFIVPIILPIRAAEV